MRAQWIRTTVELAAPSTGRVGVPRAASAVALLLAAGCAGGLSPSQWPPRDFRLDVREYVVVDGNRMREMRRFQVWEDGLAVFREATGELEDAPVSIPVFQKVSAYIMRRESTRTLSRLLYREGLFGLENGAPGDDLVEKPESHVVVAWHAFEDSRVVDTRLMTGDALDRALQVVNAFVPEGTGFRKGQLTGEPEERHVENTPELFYSKEGAVVIHRKLAELYPDDPSLRLDLFVVALEAGQFDLAEAMLRVMEPYDAQQVLGEFYEFLDWRGDFVEPMRALLERRRRGD
jgi:hypothetical protein